MNIKVGLVSYLLVNFWFTRIDANHASLKAFLMNRIGDWGLTIGIILWYIILGDVTITLILQNLNSSLIFFTGLFLFIGAIAKSAQIGQMQALDFNFKSRIPIYAGTPSYSLVSVDPITIIDPKNLLKHGGNQQGINIKKYNINTQFLYWFIGFSEAEASWFISNGVCVFSIHLHIVDLPSLIYIKSE
jgi:hypothetical protein